MPPTDAPARAEPERLIAHPRLAEYEARYAPLAARGQPCRVRIEAYRSTVVASYDPVALDSLLAWAVVNEATLGRGIGEPPPGHLWRLPLPLRCLWRSPHGLPLWAATTFAPVGQSVATLDTIHKYPPSGEWATGAKAGGALNISGSAGRWLTRQTPVAGLVAEAWQATAIGEPGEISRLLNSYVTALGRHRGRGFGALEPGSWQVEPLPAGEPFRLWDAAGRLRRSLPVLAWADPTLALGWEPGEPPVAARISPPYWHPLTEELGWRTGTLGRPA